MKFLHWFLKFFAGPKAALPATPRRVKFLEGTEWTCPECDATLGIARQDIYYAGAKRSSEWDIKDPGFWTQTHCGLAAARVWPNGRVEFHTPTGWVG